ncbi:MAG: hypothetical protein M1828_002842 [Chrysothrix sp. TS-e1954]|nr:MAG: hypothetical protein M1828_002842 [Chrysothrix sp. TS-e1954]
MSVTSISSTLATSAASSTSSSTSLQYTSTTTTTPTACAAIVDLHRTYVAPEGDADIAGIGVIVSFLASAGFVLLAALIAYRTGLIHESLLNIADREAYHARSTGSERWRGAMEKFVLVFSDQQVITGLAMLIAGFAQFQTIDVYHWQVVVYLAWMSSNTHLTTLTVLRSYLQQRHTLKTWRITGMSVMVILLIVAFVPTSSQSWLFAISQDFYEDFESSDGTIEVYDFHSAGLPARCYWKSEFMKGINDDAPFTYCILLCTYIWKATSLFDTKGRARRWYREAPVNLLGRAILRCARQIPHHDFNSAYKPRVFWYRLLVAQYAGWVCAMDFLESFLASLWALTLYFVWGALVLFNARSAVPPETRAAENKWSFGQVLPLMLLMIPALAVAEHFYRDKEPHGGAEIKEATEPVAERKVFQYAEIMHEEVDDNYSPAIVPNGLTLSGYLKSIQFAHQPLSQTLSREFLYKSKFFKSLHVWINVFLMVGSLAVFFLEALFSVAHMDILKGVLWAPIAGLAVLAFLWWVVWMTLGMFTSRIFR